MSTSEDELEKNCLVCGKDVDHGGGFSRLNVKGRMIALCCPLCLDVYQKTPERFLAKLTLSSLRPPGMTDAGFYP